MTDLTIRGGLVFDGLGSDPLLADVSVGQQRIVTDAEPAAALLDAAGCWVLPGFVDLHSHADFAVLTGEGMQLRHAAGVTTEVVGQDGLGFSPGGRETIDTVIELMGPVAGDAPEERWASTAEYLDLVDRIAVSNVAVLASHGTARIEVAGTAGRPLREEELVQLERILDRACLEGAVGLSTGLSYPPARNSNAAEITRAYRPFASRGLPYVTHLRDYGDGFETALREAVDIAAGAAGCLHLSHFHVSGPGRSGTASTWLARLRSSAQGLPLTWDSYPYTAACTFLASFLPDWVLETSSSERRRMLTEEATVIAAELDRRGPGPTVAVGWDSFLIAGTGDENADGRRLTEVALERDTTAGRVVVELCAAGGPAVLVEQGHLDNIRTLAEDDAHRGGSDGIMGSGIPHPRAAGTFLRWLRWARDEEINVTLPQMIKKLTSSAAATVGLRGIGDLVSGSLADIAVIDPELLEDGPDHSTKTPNAVRHLVIRGTPVIVDGEHVGASAAGGALRWT